VTGNSLDQKRERGSSMNRHHQPIPRLITPGEGEPFAFGDVAGRFIIQSDATGGRFVVAQLPEIPPRTLGAPLHRHHNEDEYTFVLAGTVGVMIGDEALTAEPGSWLIKPRNAWHTFWNAGDGPCSIIEIVSPAGFERYFREVAQTGGALERLAQINHKYSIDMDFESVPELCRRFGLVSGAKE
jgi:mannose-6-phosphate isomerase-like protein (cupin superfamily)